MQRWLQQNHSEDPWTGLSHHAGTIDSVSQGRENKDVLKVSPITKALNEVAMKLAECIPLGAERSHRAFRPIREQKATCLMRRALMVYCTLSQLDG